LSAEGHSSTNTDVMALAASTGPRSIERGRPIRALGVQVRGAASTGPRSIERGRATTKDVIMHDKDSLQRGRAQLSAEGPWRRESERQETDASTGPRSIERGRHRKYCRLHILFVASTGPRSIERGREPQHAGLAVLKLASTGPRSIERGRVTGEAQIESAIGGFNGAALN